MRTLPQLELSKSPLVLVLCQVRFTPILLMGEFFPRIQDKLRRQGFPLVKSTAVQELVVTPVGASTVKTNRWHVQDKTETKSILVTDSFLVYQTTAYESFEVFVNDLGLAVDTVAGEVQGLVIQRVGLRYVDLVRPYPGHAWNDYILPGLHGISHDVFLPTTQQQLHQSVAKTASGTMVVRLFQNRDGQVLPPDLTDADVKPRISPPLADGELLTLLDLDHYSVPSRPLDHEKGWVEAEAWRLHDGLDHVFRESVVTPKALRLWK
jgi:uncharacterized protein (TIGR04255 family)